MIDPTDLGSFVSIEAWIGLESWDGRTTRYKFTHVAPERPTGDSTADTLSHVPHNMSTNPRALNPANTSSLPFFDFFGLHDQGYVGSRLQMYRNKCRLVNIQRFTEQSEKDLLISSGGVVLSKSK